MEFIKIKDSSPWIIKELEQYHPDSDRHTQYWRSLKKKAIEGVWGEDFNNEFRFMPPKLWFYINFGIIQDEDKKTKARKEIKPKLADTMWEISYACLEARGFSGFEEDHLRTGDRYILKFSKSRTPTSNIDESLYFKPNGTFKDFVEPRELLRSRHDKPYGCPLYNNDAKNLIILGARSGGKSFYIAVAELLHEILFDGAKKYTEESIKNPTKVEVFLGSAIASKSNETAQKIKAAQNALAIRQDLGAWGELHDIDYEPSPFYKDMVGDILANNMRSPWRHEYEEKVNGRWVVSGTKSVLKHGVYTKENLQAAAGGRYTIMFGEEVGLWPNVIIPHWSNEACMRIGTRKFGSAFYVGTAGNMEKIIESQEIFEAPDEYNMLSYPNDWENMSTQKIGFFLPAYYTNFDFKDEHGNTDVEAAKKHYEELHEKAKQSKNSAAYEGELMNTPIYPSQMFIQKQGNIFPIAELKDHLKSLEYSEAYKYATNVTLKFDPKSISGVSYEPDTKGELKPLDRFPLPQNETNREGCVVIYEFPITDETGKVPPGLYIIGHDPVAKDDVNGDSLSAIYVLKTKKYFHKYGHDEIVATYVGRPYGGMEQVNETLEKLAMFYGASPRMIYFENMVGEVKPYFEKKKKLILLATQPQTVLTNTHKSRMSKLVYGYPMSNQYIKQETCRYIRQWLLDEWGKDDKGNVLLNLHKIRDRALIQELIAFNMKNMNADRVMAFGGCIIGLEETHNQFINAIEDAKKPNSVINFLKRGAEYLKGNEYYIPTKTKTKPEQEKQALEERKCRFPLLSSQ
ncbi:MAG: hypothetical protein KatS3mg002_1364 [Candidatus Woesearchaeota archaeon]|nr:MAG: hypothetical protein KatS3mg002_1364 [Candidatus Woesearchaeota archaeon]